MKERITSTASRSSPETSSQAEDIHCTKNHTFFFQMFWKDGLFRKNTWKYDIFFSNVLKNGLSKKILEYDLSGIICKDGNFFLPENIILFLWTENERWSFSRIHGNLIFSVYMYKCSKYDITLPPKKIKDNLLPRKCT